MDHFLDTLPSWNGVHGCRSRPIVTKSRVWPGLRSGLWLGLTFTLLFAIVTTAHSQERTLRVGIYKNSPKIDIRNDGGAEGIFIDIIEAIAESENWKIDYVPGTWSEGLDRLASGQIDLMPDVARTHEREQLYRFHHEPVLASWNHVYTRRDSGIRSLLDLNGKRIAVLENSVQQNTLQQMLASFSLSATLVSAKDFETAFADVAEKRADAVVTNRFFGVRNAQRFNLEDTAIIFSPSQLFFAAPKASDPAVLAAIDRHLQAFKSESNSVYFNSISHWMKDDVRSALPKWLVPTVLGLLGLLFVTAIWIVVMRRQVAAKTREIERRTAEVTIVNRILRTIGAQRDLQTLLDEAVRATVELTGFDGGVLCLRDPKLGNLRIGGRLEPCDKHAVEPDDGPLRDKDFLAMLQCVGVGRGHKLVATGDPNAVQPCGIGSDPAVRWNAYFVLETHGESAGVLCLFSRQETRPDDRVMHIVEDICGPLALAIENIMLYAETRQHAAELETRVYERTQKIAELSTFLQSIIDHISSPIFYKGPDLHFRGCNRAYERAFGIDHTELIGKTVLDLEYLPLADREAYQAEDATMLAAGSTLCREAAIPFADGVIHQTMYSVAGFRGASGQPLGLVGIIVDVTPLKATEAELRAAKYAAESADRMKSAFLATMSHELRTPLNSIIGFTGIILQGLAGPLTEEQTKQLGMVRDSARHLLALINDVLDISKIEAGEFSIMHEPFDLDAVLASAASTVAPLADKKGLRLEVTHDQQLGTTLGDRRRTEQVLLNLLSNAIKFTDHGSVSLHAERVSGYSSEHGYQQAPAVRFSVTDTGIGIRPTDMATLFQPFRQIESALSRNHEGTGLGLAICRRLAAIMGGSIDASSRWQEGSVFSFTLPIVTIDHGAVS